MSHSSDTRDGKTLDKNIAIGREGLRDKYSLHSFIESLLCAKYLQHFLVFGDISVGKKIRSLLL